MGETKEETVVNPSFKKGEEPERKLEQDEEKLGYWKQRYDKEEDNNRDYIEKLVKHYQQLCWFLFMAGTLLGGFVVWILLSPL